jgi:hypothetical protein
MTISAVSGQFGKARVVGGSQTYAMPTNVAVGDLIVVCGQWFNSGGAVSPAAGDLSKSAGTATIGTPTLDRSDERATSGTCGFGVWSVLVTGAGSLTLQLNVGSDYLTFEVFVATGSFDATRVEDSNSGFSTTDGETSHPSGNATSAGAALFIGTVAIDKIDNNTITEDGSFTLIAEEQDGTAWQTGAASYRIVGSGTTDSSDYTSVGNNGGWLSGIVVYREVAGVSTQPPRSMHQYRLRRAV